MKLLRWSVALSLAGMVGVVSAEGESNPTLARNLAATCANCHGTDGRAQPGPGMDALAGGDADRMMQKLRDFRSGARPATIMHQISRGYTEAQLQLIAAYFAARK